MNIGQLQFINKNDTTRAVLGLLSKSQQISAETNLESFKTFLVRKGFHLNPEDYYNLFKDLATAGVGYFDPEFKSLFIWCYAFKQVSEQILHPNKLIDIPSLAEDEEEEDTVPVAKPALVAKRKAGRPPGAKNKPKLSTEAKETVRKAGRPKGAKNRKSSAVSTPVAVPAGLTRAAQPEIIFMYRTREGALVPLSLSEAEALVKQIESIKQMKYSLSA